MPTFLWLKYVPVDISLRIFTTAMIGLLTNAYALAGVFGIVAKITSYEETTWRGFFPLAKRFYLRVLILSLTFGGLITLLIIGIRFYAGWKALGGLPGFILAGWQLTMLVLAVLMQAYMMPLAILKDKGVRETIKWSAILMVLKPGYTVLVLLQAAAIFALVSVTGVGLAILAISLTSVFLNSATRELWSEIEARWKPSRKPTSWKEIFKERQQAEEESRTLKDLFHPWDAE